MEFRSYLDKNKHFITPVFYILVLFISTSMLIIEINQISPSWIVIPILLAISVLLLLYSKRFSDIDVTYAGCRDAMQYSILFQVAVAFPLVIFLLINAYDIQYQRSSIILILLSFVVSYSVSILFVYMIFIVRAGEYVWAGYKTRVEYQTMKSFSPEKILDPLDFEIARVSGDVKFIKN